MAFQNSVLFPIGNTTHTHTNHKKGRFIKSIFPFKERFFSARCRRERQQTKQKWIPGFLQNLSVCKRGHFDGGAEQLVATCLCVSVIGQNCFISIYYTHNLETPGRFETITHRGRKLFFFFISFYTDSLQRKHFLLFLTLARLFLFSFLFSISCLHLPALNKEYIFYQGLGG